MAMKRVISWTFVLATSIAIVACADLPSEPTASKINPAAPQFDLVNMPAGKVPYIDWRGVVDIVDENGHSIWQDASQPLNGASFVFQSTPFPCAVSEFGFTDCRALAEMNGIGDPEFCGSDPDPYDLGSRLAMYYSDVTCYEAVHDAWTFPAGELWRITADATAPGGRFFQRTEISMIGLNGNPARQVLPCAEGGGSLACTVTLPQNITQNINLPLFRVYYALAYPFGGFLSPVDAPPTVNVAKAGSAVPVKFSLGSNLGLGILAAGSPSSVQVACAAAVTLDVVEETSASSNSGLKYDASSNQYTYVWKTEKSWAGTCRELRLAFTDNAPAKTAMFQFTK